MKVTVIGGGAWGSTLAELIEENHHEVTQWSRRSSLSLETALAQSSVWICAVSMKGVREVVEQAQAFEQHRQNLIVVSATKGLEASLDSSLAQLPRRPSEIWHSGFPQAAIAVLSGPNLSKEIQQGLPAATVVASQNQTAAQQVQALFNSQRFRVYTNGDPIGVELAGALKNVMAIATGACDGLNLGTNAQSALITRGLAEMIRIAGYWGAEAETLYGLAGMGDLMATCSSPLSRNYQVGYRLAQGETIDQVLATLEGTAEGINTCMVLMELANHAAIDLPITQQVYNLLQGKTTPVDALNILMSRVSKPEQVRG
jgi:glycerol-3-phosphate dehydrogenase (NAD(P)+)